MLLSVGTHELASVRGQSEWDSSSPLGLEALGLIVLTCWRLGDQPHSYKERGGRSPLGLATYGAWASWSQVESVPSDGRGARGSSPTFNPDAWTPLPAVLQELLQLGNASVAGRQRLGQLAQPASRRTTTVCKLANAAASLLGEGSRVGILNGTRGTRGPRQVVDPAIQVPYAG